MNNAKDRLKKMWDEKPENVIMIAAAVTTAAVQVVNAAVSANNSRTWKKEVNRRVKKTQ